MSARSWLLLILLGLLWGSSYLFIKVAVTEVSPVWVVGGRLIAGDLFLFAILLARRESLPPRAIWGYLAIVTVFNSTLPFLLITWGEQWISSGLAAVLNAVTPLFSVLVSTSAGDERLSWQKVVGVVIGFVGVVVLIGASVLDLTQDTVGQLAIVGASACYAVGALLARRWLKGARPVPLATAQLLFALIMVLPLMLLPQNLPASLPSLPAVGSIIALGLLGSGLAYVVYYALITAVGATRTLMVTYLIPITALFWGWLFLGEQVDLRTFVGMGLIFSGVILVNQERRAVPEAVVAKQAVADRAIPR